MDGGSVKLSAVESDLSWDKDIDYRKYGFEVHQVMKDGNPTDFKAIYSKKKDKILAMPRLGYKLLPNEVVLEIANDMADKVHLEPFKLITVSADGWKTIPSSKNKYYRAKKAGRKVVQFEPDTHVLLDSNATRMFAFYKLPKLEVMDRGEEMNFGICVRNSVDGTSGMGIEGFTYRHICSNAGLMTLTQIAKAGKQVGLYRRHTKNLDVSLPNLEETMFEVADQMGKVKDMYSRWMVEQIEKDTVNKLGRKMPVKYLPEYIEVEKKKVKMTLPEMPTSWKVYNDITEKVWHEPVELRTKQTLFVQLHNSFGLGH